MAKGSTLASDGNLLKGLTSKTAPASDSSMKLGKTSVDSEATRSEASQAEKTLGPRSA
jgi:hypothetical protein